MSLSYLNAAKTGLSAGFAPDTLRKTAADAMDLAREAAAAPGFRPSLLLVGTSLTLAFGLLQVMRLCLT